MNYFRVDPMAISLQRVVTDRFMPVALLFLVEDLPRVILNNIEGGGTPKIVTPVTKGQD